MTWLEQWPLLEAVDANEARILIGDIHPRLVDSGGFEERYEDDAVVGYDDLTFEPADC